MRKYASFFMIRFTNGLQYRSAALAGILTQLAWAVMNILLFLAFYHANPAAFPMEFSQLASYIWLKQAFFALFTSWFFDNDIFDTIITGSVAYELARPIELYDMWYVKNLAIRLSRAVLRCMPILIVALFVPAPYGLSLPHSPLSFIMFLLTLVLGLFTTVSLGMFVYISTFYTLNPIGVRVIFSSMIEFLSGKLIPLPFFPDNLQRILELTPFGSLENLPFRIYSGNIDGEEMLVFTFVQIFWLIALTLLGKIWMKKTLSHIVVQGG